MARDCGGLDVFCLFCAWVFVLYPLCLFVSLMFFFALHFLVALVFSVFEYPFVDTCSVTLGEEKERRIGRMSTLRCMETSALYCVTWKLVEEFCENKRAVQDPMARNISQTPTVQSSWNV